MLDRCNETLLLSEGDNGYLIANDDGQQDIYCGVTIKTEADGNLLSMRFLVSNQLPQYYSLLSNQLFIP